MEIVNLGEEREGREGKKLGKNVNGGTYPSRLPLGVFPDKQQKAIAVGRSREKRRRDRSNGQQLQKPSCKMQGPEG
ncbi:MAG: hypothetical protein SVX43_00810 [Cyanobacteriota bacterium]|nr:hypothetical protein [Cyanobacteriota bacterium]